MTGKVVILIAVLGVAGNASADTIYSYVGSTYEDIVDLPRPAGTFDTSMRVAGTFALAAPLAPGMPLTDVTALLESFSFSNGRHALSNLDPSITLIFSVGTNASGAIDTWVISVQQIETLAALGTDIIIQTLNDPVGGFPVEDRGQLNVCSEFDPPGICHTLADVGSVADAAGAWTSAPAQVPEPATFALCALGFWASSRRRAARRT